MTTTASPSDVRTWARQQGLSSAGRGPLPRSVVAAYAAAHAGQPIDAAAVEAPATRRRPAPAARTVAAPQTADAQTPDAATATPGTANTATAVPVDQVEVLEARLRRVEAQLAQAVERIGALEGRASRSLLGLRVTL